MKNNTFFSGKRALVVDDQELIRNMLNKLLTQLGFAEVTEATDGSNALRVLDRSGFDIIICDINMEPMGGIDFVAMLRKGANIRFDAKRARTPVLFLTGSTDKDHILSAKGLGVKDYLLKPINAVALKARLTKILTS
ncbi:response regulator [Kordiimonas aestuarii]|uniref:response regulator n=1 Tax=Kordiimonas aestuarii TaxID=1005925 RepID=UPI0021D2AF40|nr:response regulator [Kordiimonas aestuarii]